MRWLEGSPLNIESGLGGVEVHARSVIRELRARGVQVKASAEADAWADPSFDVIRTHGSALPPRSVRAGRSGNAIWIHTFHGTTWGRMKACGEYFWIGGYRAFIAEWVASREADLLTKVTPGVSFSRPIEMIGNGWDSGAGIDVPVGTDSGKPSIAFIGRDDDPVKGADLAIELAKSFPEAKWWAIPGTGFPDPFHRSGVLSSPEVMKKLGEIDVLLIPSRFEGNSLVLLEALSMGVEVISTPVGAYEWLKALRVQGFHVADSVSLQGLEKTLREVLKTRKISNINKRSRAIANRSILPTWSQVTDRLLALLERARGST